MKKGDYVHTPRFLTVRIEEVYDSEAQARTAGYKEPTHYENAEYGILGKSLDLYHMEFAAYKKQRNAEGLKKLDTFIMRLLKQYQAEYTNPEARAYFQSIGDCYGDEWQNEVNRVRRALAAGDADTLQQLEKGYTEKSKVLKGSWYDEDLQTYRSGYPFEAGFYETLADICRDAGKTRSGLT